MQAFWATVAKVAVTKVVAKVVVTKVATKAVTKVVAKVATKVATKAEQAFNLNQAKNLRWKNFVTLQLAFQWQ